MQELIILRLDYQTLKEEARNIITARVEFFAQQYGVTYGRIAIRDQRTRWGSCSNKKNLNFNFRVAFLPDEFRDYIIVHEICHLKELNHSKRFWELVSQFFPHYTSIHKQLRNYKLIP